MRRLGSVALAAAEEQREEPEDVQDVEEDARSDRHGVLHARAAQPLEVEGGEPAEDHESGERIDDVRARDRDEQRDDPEDDEGEQRPEQAARETRQVTARRPAEGAEGGDERGDAPRRIVLHEHVTIAAARAAWFHHVHG
jgi:hypothetical protein